MLKITVAKFSIKHEVPAILDGSGRIHHEKDRKTIFFRSSMEKPERAR